MKTEISLILTPCHWAVHWHGVDTAVKSDPEEARREALHCPVGISQTEAC